MKSAGLLPLLLAVSCAPAKEADRRDSITKSADSTAQVHEFLDMGLRTSLQVIKETGGFQPFGIIADGATKPRLIFIGDDVAEPERVATIEATFKRTRTIAVALFVDTRFVPPGEVEKTDAIMMQYKDERGMCMNFLMPYKRDDDGTLTPGKAVGAPRNCSLRLSKSNP